MTSAKTRAKTWPQKLGRFLGLFLGLIGAIAAIYMGILLIEDCNASLTNYDFITSVFILKTIFYLIPISGVLGLIGWWLQRGNGALVAAGSVLLMVETAVLLIVPFALGIVVDDFLGAGTSRQMNLESLWQALITPIVLSFIASAIGFYRSYTERKKV